VFGTNKIIGVKRKNHRNLISVLPGSACGVTGSGRRADVDITIANTSATENKNLLLIFNLVNSYNLKKSF
jgi:hypothetical protein